MPSPLINPNRLQQHAQDDDLRILDARFFLPPEGRDAEAEFHQAHIPGAVFFDIDAICDPDNPLPHMLPSPEDFSRHMHALGIDSNHRIVCYDEGRFMGACRAWWTFRVYGHDRVAVLDGGLPAWQAAGLPIETGPSKTVPGGNFRSEFHPERIASLPEVHTALEQATARVIDARSAARFAGQAPEPRPGLRPGHMPGALNLPFTTLIGPDGRLAAPDRLRQRFVEAGVDLDRPVITSCGSGVSAAVLLLALELLGHRHMSLYDGSWAEWGGREDTPVVLD